jgi:glutathione S-transferase
MLVTPEGSLSETIAIAKFLAHDTKFLGADLTERAVVDQWLYWAVATLMPSQFPALMGSLGHVLQTKEDFSKSLSDTKANVKAINGSIGESGWLVGSSVTVADILVAAYMVVAAGTFLDGGFRKAMPKWAAWMEKVIKLPEFVAVFGHVKLAAKSIAVKYAEGDKPKAAKKAEPAAKKPKDDDEDAPPKKEINPLDALPATSFDLFNFKTFFVNHPDKKGAAVDEMLKQHDKAGWAFWYLQYEKYGTEGQVLFKTNNLCNGFMQRFDSFRKYSFARHAVLGEEPSLEIEGVWLFRGTGIP